MEESRHERFIWVSHNFKLRILLLVFLLKIIEVLGRDLESKIFSDIFSVCSFICKITSKQLIWSFCQHHQKRNILLLIYLFLSACSFYRNQCHLWSISAITSCGSLFCILCHNVPHKIDPSWIIEVPPHYVSPLHNMIQYQKCWFFKKSIPF